MSLATLIQGHFNNTVDKIGDTAIVTRVIETSNNITGTIKSENTATTYNFKCRLEIQTESSDLVKSGQLERGDARIFLKPQDETDTYAAVENDKITWKSKTWRIRNIKPYYVAGTLIYYSCMGVKDS